MSNYDEIIHEITKYIKSKFATNLKIPSDLRKFECNILCEIMKIANDVEQELIDEAGNGYNGRTLKINNLEYINKGNLKKSVHGLFGKLNWSRAYYYSSEKSKGYCPLDETLEISDGYTPGCLYFLTRFTANGAFNKSLNRFNEIFRPAGVDSISITLAEKMNLQIGGKLESYRQKEIATLEKTGNPLYFDDENQVKEQVICCVDATKVREIIETYEESGEKRKKVDFRDGKLATFSKWQWDESKQNGRFKETTYVSGEEHADLFFKRVDAEIAKRISDTDDVEFVYIADGADWIWDRVRDTGGKNKIFILDYYHALEHVSDLAKKLYKEDSLEYNDKYSQWESKIYYGKVGEVIEELKALKKKRRGQIKDDIRKEINYFEKKKAYMNYDEYRKKRLPIGSGVVESGCKNVIGERIKGTGMIWSRTGADSMLQVRASESSFRLLKDIDYVLDEHLPVAEFKKAA